MTKELEKIFLEALELNQQKLFRICSVYAKDSEETKDLFQEAVVNIWKSLSSFKGKSAIGTWMYRVTLNTCLRLRSGRIKNQEKFIRMDSIILNKVNEEKLSDDKNDRLNQLRSCIRLLNDADKAVISLYLEELPYVNISSILGLTENNVAVKVKRIKKKLLNCINEKL
ncbi:MAG: RNA polymerase sigma factor [Maribacter sp.]